MDFKNRNAHFSVILCGVVSSMCEINSLIQTALFSSLVLAVKEINLLTAWEKFSFKNVGQRQKPTGCVRGRRGAGRRWAGQTKRCFGAHEPSPRESIFKPWSPCWAMRAKRRGEDRSYKGRTVRWHVFRGDPRWRRREKEDCHASSEKKGVRFLTDPEIWSHLGRAAHWTPVGIIIKVGK